MLCAFRQFYAREAVREYMIHQYKLNGYNIVLDVYSGSVHVTDDASYDLIACLDQGMEESAACDRIFEEYRDRGVTRQDTEEILEDIRELRSMGKLFTEDRYRDKAFDLKQRSTVVKALCLLVAHTCNLSCEYCFASQGHFKGQDGLMSFETGKRALDFLVEHSGSRRNLEVDFFGGEPLVNFQVCKDLVAYARSIEKEKNKKAWTDAKRSMTASGWTVPGRAAMIPLSPNSGNLSAAAGGRAITCGAPIPISIQTLPMIFSIWRTIWALPSCPWNRS